MNDNQETQVLNPETQTSEAQPQQTEPETVKETNPQPAEGNETAEESAKSDGPAKSDGVPETEKSGEVEPKSPEAEQEKEKSTEEEQKTEVKEEAVKEEPKKKMDEWCAKAIEDGMRVFEEVYPIEKWTLDNESDGIRTLSRYDEGTGLKMTRGEGEIARPMDQIKDVLMNPSEVLKWEGSLIANDIVEKTDEYTIIQSLDQKRAFVTQRETLIIIKSFQREDGSTVVIERSVDHPKFPERSEYVRAFVHLWACVMKPKKDDPTKTETSFIIFLDPKGWVPKALFNAVVNGQALNVQKLKTYLEKH